MVEEFRIRLQSLIEVVNLIKGKVENLSNLITLAQSGVTGLVKKVVNKKAKDWLEDTEEEFNDAAKNAVNKAVEETSKKIRKATSKIKK